MVVAYNYDEGVATVWNSVKMVAAIGAGERADRHVRPTAPSRSTDAQLISGHPNGNVAPLAAVRSLPGLIDERRSRQHHRRPPAASPFSARPGQRGAAIMD
ncbi:orotidine 5'-phosphate decarboxylase [Striga asiatica]|uniref:Orotidine 5'-phosphate decarboxylase n=1 Tax=Striga asiatica TaxID=4170 RepID=A0A5A7Q778_STRAF|nr:orotidine 5'-phosphate decarboxylase [Striga asiatica]